jgi:Mannitol dehydrogenase C-terminal domain
VPGTVSGPTAAPGQSSLIAGQEGHHYGDLVRLMKLRLLNGSHQVMCYFAYLSGYRLVHQAAQDPLFRGFLLGYMDQEATPTLPPVPG